MLDPVYTLGFCNGQHKIYLTRLIAAQLFSSFYFLALSRFSSHKIKIPAGGSQLVELPLEIEYEKLLKGLESIFKKKAMRFQLNGEIDFGLINVPYRKTGEFSI